MRVISWSKLIISILLAQFAGLLGTIFTFDAIPNWYATLIRPDFAPPNWIFGPVWTVLYTLIGISLYLIWTNKKGSLKLFLFHLFLNAIWSPIFFGAKNLGLALIVILMMDITLIIIIKNFYKINKVASLVLIPYLMWISFATILNFSFWQLNLNRVYAQEFNSAKAYSDYVFTEDIYKTKLAAFNLKKDSYQKNPTLSLKEEVRVALLDFLGSRDDLFKNYLTLIRIKALESEGLTIVDKQNVYSKLDPEVLWFSNQKTNYTINDPLENLITKSHEEDLKYQNETLPVIYYALATLSRGETIRIKNKHVEIYKKLKTEADDLVKLGRADSELFNRWFKDIDKELENLSKVEAEVQIEIDKIFGVDEYLRNSGYKKAIEELEPAKASLLKLNGFLMELETTINTKR